MQKQVTKDYTSDYDRKQTGYLQLHHAPFVRWEMLEKLQESARHACMQNVPGMHR